MQDPDDLQPDISPVKGSWWRPSYILKRDWWAYWKDEDGRQLRALVPRNLRLDGSSEWILIGLLGIFPLGGLIALLFRLGADGPHRAAAVLHDWVYGCKGDIEYQVLVRGTWLTHTGLDRSEADWAFRSLAIDGGLLPWQAWPRWAALRIVARPWWGRLPPAG